MCSLGYKIFHHTRCGITLEELLPEATELVGDVLLHSMPPVPQMAKWDKLQLSCDFEGLGNRFGILKALVLVALDVMEINSKKWQPFWEKTAKDLEGDIDPGLLVQAEWHKVSW